MWTYSQSKGDLRHGDALIANCYAGRGKGKNNPNFQDQHDVGPLPQGFYTIGSPVDHPHLGPLAFPLYPDAANQMFGRSAFLIHADSVKHPGEASEGCIVTLGGIKSREAIALIVKTDNRLQVIS